MRNIFYGLCYCVLKSEKSNVKGIRSKFILEVAKYKINKNSFGKEISSDIPGDLTIEIEEYAPKVFQKIREFENLTIEQLLLSLNPVNNTTLIKSQGQSSSFFCSTDDNRFIIKTITKAEHEFIINHFLIYYYNHLTNYPDSLVCRIYGIFRVNIDNGDPMDIILMRDGRGALKKFIKNIYDLKGSKANREVKESIDNPKAVRKDLNFDKEIKHLEIEERNKFIESIKNDSEFFEDLNIMDYSLLVIKLELNDSNINDFISFKNSLDFPNYKRHIYQDTSNRNIVYILMIIDYLQIYSFFKFLVNNFKVHILERPPNNDDISCVEPNTYANRFYKYISKITLDRSSILNKD